MMSFFSKPLVAFLVLFTLAACSPQQQQSSQPDFQRSLNDRPYGWKSVSTPDPVRRGVKAQRFELRDGECAAQPEWSDCANDRTRTEMSGRQTIPLGADRWISFSLRLPEDFPLTDPPVHLSLFQLHTRGGELRSAFGMPASAAPALQVRLNNGVLYAHLNDLDRDPGLGATAQRRMFKLADVNDLRGKWVDVVLHIDTTPETGFIEAWVNGDKKFRKDGFVRQKNSEGHYVKYGIYNTLVSKLGRPMPTQVAWYDEIRIGRKREDVDFSINPALAPVD